RSPASPNYTPTSPDYSPASDTESDPSEDPSSDHIPPLPATSPFLSSTDDSSDIDIPDTPPSPTHGTPFTETTLSTQRSPVTSDSSLNSSSVTSLDSFADVLSDSTSSDSSSDHSLPALSSGMRPSHHLCLLVPSIHRSSAAIFARPSHDSSSASPSRKRSRSPAASVSLSLPIPGVLSYARANHLPSPKRIRSSDIATDLEVSSDDRFEPYVPKGTNLEMDIDVCIAYADALRDRGIDARVVVEAVDRDEIRKYYKSLTLYHFIQTRIQKQEIKEEDEMVRFLERES
nr:hypothetical protein [Tanacetum cinerariifolium]